MSTCLCPCLLVSKWIHEETTEFHVFNKNKKMQDENLCPYTKRNSADKANPQAFCGVNHT